MYIYDSKRLIIAIKPRSSDGTEDNSIKFIETAKSTATIEVATKAGNFA